MRKARVGGIAVASLLAAVGIGLLAAEPASADVSGGCSASLNGHNLNNVSINRGTYVEVGKDDVVPMTMTAPGDKKFDELHIYLTFAGADIDIYDAPAGGGTWSHNVDVHSFARFGVGFYDLKGVGTFTDGSYCDGEALIKVSGDPLSTLTGDAALGGTVAGVLGMLGAGLSAKPGGDGGTGPGGSVTQSDVKKEEEYERAASDADAEAENVTHGWCSLFVLVVLLALPLLLLFGTGALAMAVVAPVVRVKRRNWPLVLGAFSGLLTGLGAGVLLQEYAIVYPTRTYAIIYIAGGILFGLAVPMLRRSLSR